MKEKRKRLQKDPHWQEQGVAEWEGVKDQLTGGGEKKHLPVGRKSQRKRRAKTGIANDEGAHQAKVEDLKEAERKRGDTKNLPNRTIRQTTGGSNTSGAQETQVTHLQSGRAPGGKGYCPGAITPAGANQGIKDRLRGQSKSFIAEDITGERGDNASQRSERSDQKASSKAYAVEEAIHKERSGSRWGWA